MLSKWWLINLLFLLSCMKCQEIVSPSFTTSTSEIYNKSTIDIYRDKKIICTKSKCKIVCEGNNACYNITIDGKLSSTLSLICIGDYSCKQSNIINGAQITTDINCGKLSCYQSVFNFSNSMDVNIECGYQGCYNIKEIHGELVSNSLNIHCPDYYSCWIADIYCPIYNDALCNITCNDAQSSCWGIDIYIQDRKANVDINCPIPADAGWSEFFSFCTLDIICNNGATTPYIFIFDGGVRSQFFCKSDGCCPFSLFEEVISCNDSTTDCMIDCTNKDCRKRVINGTGVSSSLYVHCDGDQPSSGDGRCEKANILCPTNGIASCNVNCTRGACGRAIITATDAYSLDLNCQGYASYDSYHCYDSVINCPSDPNSCNINCNGADGCDAARVNAANSYELNLNCLDEDSCRDMDVYCPYDRVSACNIDCTVNKSLNCLDMNIMVNDDFIYGYLNIQCPPIPNKNQYGIHECSRIEFECNSKTTAGFIFNNITNQYQCDSLIPSTSYCCPWQYTPNPTMNPTEPTINPTNIPTIITINPTSNPSNNPTLTTENPTNNPTSIPTNIPTIEPTESTVNPTIHPTLITNNPTSITNNPSVNPSNNPTRNPTNTPTTNPSINPTQSTVNPTSGTLNPSNNPTSNPTKMPTNNPTAFTIHPTTNPTMSPIMNSTKTHITNNPTNIPTNNPTNAPTNNSTNNPTNASFIEPSFGTDAGINVKSNNNKLLFIFNIILIILLSGI